MTRHEERQKVIATAVAAAANNPLAPAWAKVGFAAMAEELRDLHLRLAAAEGRIFDLQGEVLQFKNKKG